MVPAHTAAAHHTFELLHTWLGTVLGETIGYALTATFTVLVVIAITRTVAPRWIAFLGYAPAALIATGVVIPLGVGGASITNFVGYVAWCLSVARRHGRRPLELTPGYAWGVNPR